MPANLSLVPNHWWDDLPTEVQTTATKVAAQAAAKALPKSFQSGRDHWSTLVRREDLLAEAMSLLVLDDGDLRAVLDVEGDPNYGILQHRLYCDLLNVVQTHRGIGAGVMVGSYDEHMSSHDDDGTVIEGPWIAPNRVAVMQGACNVSATPVSMYDVDQVERLAPTIANLIHYDALMCETAPDRDMPAGKRSPATGGNLLVSAIDVRKVWEKAIGLRTAWDRDAGRSTPKEQRLTNPQRRAFELRYFDNLLWSDVGKAMGVARQTATKHAEAAVVKLLWLLNGEKPTTVVLSNVPELDELSRRRDEKRRAAMPDEPLEAAA